ncbi:MAG TPA: DUF2141 domain-containing protein [Croceibacterium sp.]|jgi:uncharacterized protein (DUF2141 family)
MKHFLRYLPSALALLWAANASAEEPACTGPQSPVKLFVDVEGIRSSDGLIAVTLYADDSSKFLAHHGSLYVGRVPAHSGATSVCIHVPRPGIYALAVYHDANANRHYDRTGVGLPAEGYGFSNNPKVFLGMPAWKSVRLEVPKTGTHTAIRLRYP